MIIYDKILNNEHFENVEVLKDFKGNIEVELRFETVYNLLNSSENNVLKPKHIFFIVGNRETDQYLFNSIGYANSKLSELESLTILLSIDNSVKAEYFTHVLSTLNINREVGVWSVQKLLKVKYNGYEREVKKIV
jgi:hypothetical protein